jgi:hypothetical protein
MKRIRWRAIALVLTAAAALLPGCGSSTATVSGEVTLDGRPVGNGYITFTPEDGKGPDAGGVIVNGRYSVSRLPAGPKVVRVMGVKKVNFASTSEEMKERAAEARKAGNYDGLVDPADTIPKNAEGNNRRIEIRAGSNTQDFHLTAGIRSKVKG